MKIHLLFKVTALLTFTLFLLPCCDLYFPPKSFTGPFSEPTPAPTYEPVPSLIPTPSVPPDGEMIYNNDFSNGLDSWTNYINTDAGTNATIDAVAEQAVITIINGSTEGWHIQLIQTSLYIEQGKTYTLSFDAWATEGVSRDISVEIGEDGYDNNGDDYKYTTYTWQSVTLPTAQPATPFSWEFTMTEITDELARLVFNAGADDNDVTIDNVSLKEVIP